MAIEVSVVIPTYNRKEKLTKVLKALAIQNFPKEKYEVIVVDDGGSQNILSVINNFPGINIKYIYQQRSGPGTARNTGIRISQGEIICFTDDDCIPDRTWLEQYYKIFINSNYKYKIIGGKTEVRSSNLKAVLGQFMANGAIFAKVKGEKKIVFFPTSNVALKKDIFQNFLFNPVISYPGGEDLEFFWRIFKSGENLKFAPDIKVLHFRNESFKEFLHQPYIYGRGNYWVKKIAPVQPAIQELTSTKKILYALTQIPLYAVYIALQIKKVYRKGVFDFILLFFYIVIYRLIYFWGYFTENFKNGKN